MYIFLFKVFEIHFKDISNKVGIRKYYYQVYYNIYKQIIQIIYNYKNDSYKYNDVPIDEI